ncbi:MAG: hypothetical protein KAR42_07905 [candidate division Zixibacteria bacterium]|nr:hypothetical protein [candidate division Zixibacteria bacterium]
MSRLLLIVISLFMLLAGISAEQISVQYSFQHPTIDQVRIGNDEFDVVVMPGAPNCGLIGEPGLPGYPAKILLPYGTEVESIKIITRGEEYLGDGFFIKPVPMQYKLSEMPTEIVPPTPDMSIYSVDNLFPAERFEKSGIHNFRGYSILYLKLQPMEYYPVSGELYYFSELEVIIETKASDKSTGMFRGFENDDEKIRAKVDNPELADSYSAASKNGYKSYDMLILTTEAFASAFQPLKDYHDTTGILTEIHTTTEVGSTNPEDIRDYIRERYLNDGIDYVIIGADDNIIPAKDLYVEMSPGGEAELNMPCDLYFACLDGTYNYDNDSRWGEPTDGVGGGDVDLVAEIFIGRASIGDVTEASRYVTKTLTYVNATGQYLQNVILVGEHLGFGGDAEYANNYLDELVDGSSNHGYTTTGIPSSVFTVDKLYDYSWPGNSWPKSELITRINSGQHIINHLGHGSPDYAMKLYNSDVLSSINNTQLSFVYSQTCLAGHFDDEDCWAEHMNIKIDEGAFAVIMNARYGFGQFNSTDGASQRYDREFWDAVFNPAEGKAQIGPANHDSKEDNIYRVNDDYMRWCMYELHLFGDPSISFKGVEGLSFTFGEDIPETVYPGQETFISVTVAAVGDGVPVSGTGELHYSINSGAYQTVSMTEVLANEYETNLPAIICGDTLRFYISAEEVSNGTIYDTDPSSPHVVLPATGMLTAFEDDFETDKGWVISGGDWARGIPTGSGGEHGYPDPTSGHTDPNIIGYNLFGDYGANMSEYHITSPVMDCSGLSDTKLKFWRWLGVEQTSYDHAYIRLSTNGTNWTTIWENGGTISDNAWSEKEYDISDLADGQSVVYIRFTQGTSDGSWFYCGWNIDDLTITGRECADYGLTISTESLPDWTIDYAYDQQLNAVNGVGVLSWSDKNGDLIGTGLALATDGQITGTPTTAQTITFTAEVTDEEPATSEKEFSFIINPSVEIASVSLPDWTAGHSYNQQLTASGGTGAINWSDKDGGLSGTGLTLASDGSISGTPLAGVISFLAEATDAIGDADEQQVTITINDELAITNESLPGGRLLNPYSTQLVSSGGTGNISWSELGSNLSTIGLALFTTGQISGTPNSEGQVTFTARVMDEIGAQTTKQFTITIAADLSIVTSTVPDWTMGIAYSYQMSVMGAIGTVAWQDKNNDLDGTGMTLASNGVLSGTVTTAMSITFTALVTDDDSQTDEREYTFTIHSLPVVTTETLPDWTVSVAYSQQLTMSGGSGTKTWVDKNNSLDGTGLSLTSAGVVTGTPTMFGTIAFTAQVTDYAGASGEKELSFQINFGISITSASELADGEEGESYSEQLVASGGTGVLTWLDKNTVLEGYGLALSTSGLVSGIPNTYGVITFVGKVSDEIGASSERTFTITVNRALVISTESLPDWTVNIAYSQSLEALGGAGSKSWSDKNSELDGTGLTLSVEGVVSGEPASSGDISFTAVVADDRSTVEKQFVFHINPSIGITTESLPQGHLDTAYTFQLVSSGGTGAKSWEDANSDLASYGLILSTSGMISGTPIQGGLIEFAARVTDNCGAIDEKALTLDIKLPYVCGDANGDSEVNVADAVFLINYVFKGGPAPEPEESGDANGDGSADVGDAVYIVNYAFRGGPEPVCP